MPNITVASSQPVQGGEGREDGEEAEPRRRVSLDDPG